MATIDSDSARPCDWIEPDWPAPPGVRAMATTRHGGVSLPPFDQLNLGDHVGDEPSAVAENRCRLQTALQLPAQPVWLNQIHGIDVVDAGHTLNIAAADASYTVDEGVVCAVMSADCLPVLLCDLNGRCVAAVHAGWRGLADGVIEATVRRMVRRSDAGLMAWLGPAIGAQAFEVGDEVRQTFLKADPNSVAAFERSGNGRWLADLYALARQRLQRLGVEHIYGGHWCTFRESGLFFSYRRDGATGRMATLIWMESS